MPLSNEMLQPPNTEEMPQQWYIHTVAFLVKVPIDPGDYLLGQWLKFDGKCTVVEIMDVSYRDRNHDVHRGHYCNNISHPFVFHQIHRLSWPPALPEFFFGCSP